MILAIDPGNLESAYVLMDGYRPVECGKVENERLLNLVLHKAAAHTDFVIEMVASYGMPVGETVFETVFWIGRLYELADGYRSRSRVYRRDVKLNLCGQARAKDSNIRRALLDRFGVVGTKREPGWFYGFKADIWAAYAVGVTYLDSGASVMRR